ncbi:VanZ family protein [Texcoconibacillus texcoconensis]|uniref:Glycopeptide antibiotics resistance protein n=1 Tax=Texcoconibacillus texcoconensis TaxID=1095777 RepID=A0A840QT70_9BACI|nr:VanZ family protein [Texcoconibacillus texcoconensis]MBB5174467.1 glycopeptide antibiotics resistance protein [Texcoconibacillus texcoconensis]
MRKRIFWLILSERKFIMICFIVYVLFLFYITLFAWNHGASLGDEGPGGRNYNLVPGLSIYRIAVFSPTYIDPLIILLGNVLLFFPLGFFMTHLFKIKWPLLFVTILGFFVSLFIEVNQFLFTQRVANVDDLILNTLGAFLGALFALTCRFFNKWGQNKKA